MWNAAFFVVGLPHSTGQFAVIRDVLMKTPVGEEDSGRKAHDGKEGIEQRSDHLIETFEDVDRGS